MGKISKNELNTSLTTKIEEIDLKANISDLETTNTQLAQIEENLDTHTSNNTNAHGATSNPTGNTIASRDFIGRLFTEPIRALTAVGQTLNLSSKNTSVYGNNPTVTLERNLGGADATSETCLFVTKRATTAIHATTGLYLLVRQGDASYVIPIINDPNLTIVINAGFNVTVSTSGTALIQCDMIAIGG